MPETMTPPAKPKPKGGWFRRAVRVAGVLLLVVAIFHRPLFHFTLRIALRLVAARMHLSLDLHTSGTIFTNFTVEDLHARATGDGTTPVRAIDISRVQLEYSLPHLVKHGVGEFLRSYEIHNANLDLVALPSKSQHEHAEKVSIAKQLDTLLGQPAAYADRVWIENFNLSVTAPDNVTQIKDFNLLLDPEKPGYLRLGKLAAPGVPPWENLAAETSYTARNFFIKNLRFAPELVLDEMNFDASQRAQNKGSVMIKAHAFGGTAEFDLAGSQLNKKGENLENSYDTTLKIDVAGVALDRAAAYFKAPAPPVKQLARLAIQFSGEPEKPRSWRGNVGARVESIAAGATTIGAAEFGATIADGRAEISGGNIAAGQNNVTFTATVALPASVNEFPKSEVDAALRINAPDLPFFTNTMPTPLNGTVAGTGTIALHGGILRANLALDAQTIAGKDLGLDAGKVTLQATTQVDPAPASPFEALDAHLAADLTALRFQTFNLDSAKLDVETRNGLVKLHPLDIRRGENFVSAEGTAHLPRDPKLIAKMPIDAQFTIHVPQLDNFGIAAGGQTLNGKIEGAGTMKMVDGALAGGIKIDGSDFTLGEFKAERLAAKIDVANNEANIDQIALQFGGPNQIVVSGKVGLAKPFAYEGGVLLDVKDLGGLNPLLAVFGQKQQLAGAVSFQWNGKGGIDPQNHSGEMDLKVTKAKFGNVEVSEVQLSGLYTPEFAESKPFKIVAGATTLGGAIEYREARLRLKDIKLEQAGTSVLTGFIFLPFDPANTKQPIALDQRIAANINTDKLDVEKLLASFGQVAPVSGSFTANLVAGGTLLEPFADLKVAADRLQAKAAKQFDPGSLALNLHYSNKDLALGATVKQPQIQPLTIKAHAPLDLDATIKAGRVDPQLPIEASAELPASSLAFVPKVAPQVRRIDGTAALDAHVTGTVGKPVISGGVNVELKSARMVDENVPGIGGFHAKIGFAENKVNFQTFEGEVGGGKFKLGGSVDIADTKNPVFGLRLESNEVLVKRDDSITVRADTDIKLDGPLNAAAVSGAVYVVRSRFFKEVDILPIALPGKPKPAPKTANTGPTVISFPQPPLRDMKFDLAIKTREKDPFLILGNLANGAVSLNLKLGGTGLAPYLEGTANIDRFTATLPFSTLTIDSGFVAFNKDQPFEPSMELQAESQIRDYLVHAYIYGKTTEPQVIFSSEPPLTHADIVSLLATGTTVSELASNADALATRAAMLAVKQLYLKIFKKGATPPPEEKKKSDSSLLDRFEFEMGELSNRSSRQEVKARFKVSDQVYLIGDVGVDGSFTGSLKYLIRFR